MLYYALPGSNGLQPLGKVGGAKVIKKSCDQKAGLVKSRRRESATENKRIDLVRSHFPDACCI
jgi:hypothetical protein